MAEKHVSTTISISTKTILFTVFLLLGLGFVFLVHQILMIFFLALIVMSALHPAFKFLQKKLKFPRWLAICTIYLVVIILITLTLLLVIPPLSAQLPKLIDELSKLPAQLPGFITSLHLPLSSEGLGEIQFSLNQFQDLVTSSLQPIAQIVTSTIAAIFSFFTILVLSCYLILERDELHKKVGWFTNKEKHFKLAEEFVNSVEMQLGGWVRGQIMLMVLIGVVTFIGLSLLRIPYALPLALLAGFLEILPNLGPTIAAFPAIIIAGFTLGLPMAGVITFFYIIVQQLENNLIVPKIMKDNADVNPLITILLILVGFKVAGVLGALLAVPFYILIRSAYSLWRREAALHSEI
jgi:predicted PurR-regulated permease PerM